MADNLSISTAGGGTATVATDDVGTVHHQRFKTGFGVDGSYGDVTPANPLPAREPQSGTAALTSVTSSASTGTLKAANTARLGMIVVNESTATLYIAYATAASLIAYTVAVPPSYTWEMPRPIYTGDLAAIWSAANGAARVTELT